MHLQYLIKLCSQSQSQSLRAVTHDPLLLADTVSHHFDIIPSADIFGHVSALPTSYRQWLVVCQGVDNVGRLTANNTEHNDIYYYVTVW